MRVHQFDFRVNLTEENCDKNKNQTARNINNSESPNVSNSVLLYFTKSFTFGVTRGDKRETIERKYENI
jgi:hypothetical protein